MEWVRRRPAPARSCRGRSSTVDPAWGRAPRRTRAAGSGGEAFPILTGHRAVGSPSGRRPAVGCPAPGQSRPLAVSGISRLAQQLRQLLAMLAAMRRASSRLSRAQQYVGEPGRSGSARLALETTFMTPSRSRGGRVIARFKPPCSSLRGSSAGPSCPAKTHRSPGLPKLKSDSAGASRWRPPPSR